MSALAESTDISAVVVAYRALHGDHIARRFTPSDVVSLVDHYGPIFALRLMTGHPVDETMRALDEARAQLRRGPT